MELKPVESQPIGANAFVVKCAFCGGRGLQPINMEQTESEKLFLKIKEWSVTEPCRICDGKGVVKVESNDILIGCPICRSSGHDPNVKSQHPTHTHLADTGYTVSDKARAYAKEQSDKPCPKCEGTGIRTLSGTVKIVR